MRRMGLALALSVVVGAVAAPASAGSPVDVTTGLTLPNRAHVDALTQSLGYEFGRVEIPAIGVEEVIREGVSLDIIDQGVAHWTGTARPGGVGNLVLAGHRTIHTAPFYDLDRLSAGDQILVMGIGGIQATYEVSDTLIVRPSDIWVVEQTDQPMLTLFACHPKGSATQRIVVQASLVDAPPLEFP